MSGSLSVRVVDKQRQRYLESLGLKQSGQDLSTSNFNKKFSFVEEDYIDCIDVKSGKLDPSLHEHKHHKNLAVIHHWATEDIKPEEHSELILF